MAGLLRCFPSPSRPKPAEVLQRFSGGVLTSEKMVLLPYRKKKAALFSFCVQASEKYQIPSSSMSPYSMKNMFPVANSNEANDGDEEIHNLCHIMMKYISKHQKVVPSNFLRSFALTSSLMLFLPSKVLAETCEADNSFFNMPLLFAIAMIGATVGGLLARQRRGELKRLNDQLRQINAALRRQAKIESYAPNLSYAPVGTRMGETEVIVDPRKEQLITNLRTGKNYLRNQDPEKAFAEFKAALELAQALGDYVEEKKAARGLGASLQRQGRYREAIKYHSLVLDTCKRVGEDSGVTEAYGAIADCYTELGELEQAGKFYDKYIARLESD